MRNRCQILRSKTNHQGKRSAKAWRARNEDAFRIQATQYCGKRISHRGMLRREYKSLTDENTSSNPLWNTSSILRGQGVLSGRPGVTRKLCSNFKQVSEVGGGGEFVAEYYRLLPLLGPSYTRGKLTFLATLSLSILAFHCYTHPNWYVRLRWNKKYPVMNMNSALL